MIFLTLNIRFNWSTSDFPGNSAFISNNSAKIQPTDHMSIGVEYSFAHNSNSGALYHNVTTIGVYCFSGEPYSLASPKSPTCKIKITIENFHKIRGNNRKCYLLVDTVKITGKFTLLIKIH